LFAGEDRPIAELLAGNLVTKGVNVFHDEYAQMHRQNSGGTTSTRICRRSPERKPSSA
jgi:hypothetical protein